jgi:outer membrane lipoprotein-sorting protein
MRIVSKLAIILGVCLSLVLSACAMKSGCPNDAPQKMKHYGGK